MKLGLRRGTVALEPHQPEWERIAAETAEKLRNLLKDTAVDVQHIGSTAIRGICAKPIIDIVVGVTDFQKVLAKNRLLAENGFIFRAQDLPEQYLYVCGGADDRTHHIHVVRYGSDAWNDYINMRDYLNCHKADAEAYAALKTALAAQYPDDRETYTAEKSTLIQEILAKAKRWRSEQPDR